MKKELWWLFLLLGAMLAKILPTGHLGIARGVVKNDDDLGPRL
jgi:hypothetical protein